LAVHFFEKFSKAARCDSKTHTLGKYLIELTSLNYTLLKFLPSEIAASATYIAKTMTKTHDSPPVWNDTIEHHTRYSVEDIMPCIAEMNQFAFTQNSPECKHKAVKKKYSSTELMSVSSIALVHI
jgi:hypothetical protein